MQLPALTRVGALEAECIGLLTEWSGLSMSERPISGEPENNVYTVLLMIATVLVAAATVFLAVRSQQLFGSWNPFSGA